MSAAMGAVGGIGASIGRAYTKNAFKHSVSNMTWRESSKRWKTVSQRYRKYINDSGAAPAKKWEAHHWFIERNGKFNKFFNKKIPEYLINHPLNLKSMPKGNHRKMTGKWDGQEKYTFHNNGGMGLLHGTSKGRPLVVRQAELPGQDLEGAANATIKISSDHLQRKIHTAYF